MQYAPNRSSQEHPLGACEAVVDELAEPGRLRLRLTAGERPIIKARIAVQGYDAVVGDRVLVLASPSGGEHFVVGILVSSESPVLRVGDAEARSEGGAIVIRDAQGQAVVQYDPETGGLTLSAEEGELTLRGKKVVVESAEDLELRADVIKSDAREVRTQAEFVGFTSARWDLSVGKITERARHVFRDVSGVLQTRAKRASLIAENTLTLFGRRTSVRSKEDTTIKGRRVLLG